MFVVDIIMTSKEKETYQYNSILFSGFSYVFHVKEWLQRGEIKLVCSSCVEIQRRCGGIAPIIFFRNGIFLKDWPIEPHLCSKTEDNWERSSIYNRVRIDIFWKIRMCQIKHQEKCEPWFTSKWFFTFLIIV